MSDMAMLTEFRRHAQPRRGCVPLTKGLLWGGTISALMWAAISWAAVRVL